MGMGPSLFLFLIDEEPAAARMEHHTKRKRCLVKHRRTSHQVPVHDKAVSKSVWCMAVSSTTHFSCPPLIGLVGAEAIDGGKFWQGIALPSQSMSAPTKEGKAARIIKGPNIRSSCRIIACSDEIWDQMACGSGIIEVLLCVANRYI